MNAYTESTAIKIKTRTNRASVSSGTGFATGGTAVYPSQVFRTEGGMIPTWSMKVSVASVNEQLDRPQIFEDDPELAAMTDTELVAAAKALYGAWADREDIGETWLEDLRAADAAEWDKRLAELYGPDFPDLSV